MNALIKFKTTDQVLLKPKLDGMRTAVEVEAWAHRGGLIDILCSIRESITEEDWEDIVKNSE